MSRYYEMSIEVKGYDDTKEIDIREAVSVYDELKSRPALCKSQSLDLKKEDYVMVDGQMCLERIWLSRDPFQEAAVQVERRECPNGSWENVAEYEVEWWTILSRIT